MKALCSHSFSGQCQVSKGKCANSCSSWAKPQCIMCSWYAMAWAGLGSTLDRRNATQFFLCGPRTFSFDSCALGLIPMAVASDPIGNSNAGCKACFRSLVAEAVLRLFTRPLVGQDCWIMKGIKACPCTTPQHKHSCSSLIPSICPGTL
jgi:hypothetical protein